MASSSRTPAPPTPRRDGFHLVRFPPCDLASPTPYPASDPHMRLLVLSSYPPSAHACLSITFLTRPFHFFAIPSSLPRASKTSSAPAAWQDRSQALGLTDVIYRVAPQEGMAKDKEKWVGIERGKSYEEGGEGSYKLH